MAALTLNSLERRVFGVLIEKSLAQPEYYPMTLNSIVTACNQKNHRDPVMELEEDAVWQTLEALRSRGLVSKVLPSGSSRVERYKHEVTAALQWEKPQRAVLAELMLRGPQTVGELRGRASRMYAFDNLESVTAVLDWLAQHDPPLVRALPRGPRESAARFAHTLAPPGETPDAPADGETHVDSADAAGAAPRTPPPSALAEQVDAMQTEIAELHQAVAGLRRRLDAIEGR